MQDWEDGLPGVGEVVEWSVQPECNNKIRVRAYDGEDFWVEFIATGGSYVGKIKGSFRPIKKREPKSGQVFTVDGNEGWICINDGEKYSSLDGDDVITESDAILFKLEYAAPDVKSYITRKLLKDAKSKTEDSGQAINTEGWKLLKQAARLDEE